MNTFSASLLSNSQVKNPELMFWTACSGKGTPNMKDMNEQMPVEGKKKTRNFMASSRLLPFHSDWLDSLVSDNHFTNPFPNIVLPLCTSFVWYPLKKRVLVRPGLALNAIGGNGWEIKYIKGSCNQRSGGGRAGIPLLANTLSGGFQGDKR